MSKKLKILWVAAVVWALTFLLWAMGLIFGANSYFMGLIFLVVAMLPIILLVKISIKKAADTASAYEAMLKAAGVARGSGVDHSEAETGIAINKTAQTLTLLKDGSHKTYLYTDVRKWESRKERPGQFVGGGNLSSIAMVMTAEANAKREASANTGLFVTVRDVDNPVWRIAMKDEGQQARWMEILEQELNERK